MNKDIVKIRKQILDSFLENLWGISDLEYQRRVWIEAKGPECDDFTEAVCDFFDLGEGIFENYKDYRLTDDQYYRLLRFKEAFDAFIKGPRPYLERDFIDTPEWTKITEMAKEVLKAFNYQKPNK